MLNQLYCRPFVLQVRVQYKIILYILQQQLSYILLMTKKMMITMPTTTASTRTPPTPAPTPAATQITDEESKYIAGRMSLLGQNNRKPWLEHLFTCSKQHYKHGQCCTQVKVKQIYFLSSRVYSCFHPSIIPTVLGSYIKIMKLT